MSFELQTGSDLYRNPISQSYLATLDDWNKGIADYFLDGPDAQGKIRRFSMTESIVRVIGDNLGVHKDDAMSDLVKCTFDENDPKTQSDGNPEKFWHNAKKLAKEYNTEINQDPSLYPELIPPFLAHMAISIVGMNKFGKGNQVYPPLGKIIWDSLGIPEFSTEPNNTFRDGYYKAGSYGTVSGFCNENITINGSTQNVWLHLETWSKERNNWKQDNGKQLGGELRSKAASYDNRVTPIRHASTIRNRDEKAFSEILSTLDANFEPSRDLVRTKIMQEKKQNYSSAVGALINRGIMEDLIDHVLQRWASEDSATWVGGQKTSSQSSTVFQVEPVFTLDNNSDVQYMVLRLKQVKGVSISGKIRLDIGSSKHSIELHVENRKSDYITKEDTFSAISEGDFELYHEENLLQVNSLFDLLSRGSVTFVNSGANGIWERGEPVANQSSAIVGMASHLNSKPEVSLSEKLGRDIYLKPVSLNYNITTSSNPTISQKLETRVRLHGGIRLPTGEYLKNNLPYLQVTRGSPEAVVIFPDLPIQENIISWDDYLQSSPKLTENKWLFSAKDNLPNNQIVISFQIGSNPPESRTIELTDGADLWRDFGHQKDQFSDFKMNSESTNSNLFSNYNQTEKARDDRLRILEQAKARGVKSKEEPNFSGLGFNKIKEYLRLPNQQPKKAGTVTSAPFDKGKWIRDNPPTKAQPKPPPMPSSVQSPTRVSPKNTNGMTLKERLNNHRNKHPKDKTAKIAADKFNENVRKAREN